MSLIKLKLKFTVTGRYKYILLLIINNNLQQNKDIIKNKKLIKYSVL